MDALELISLRYDELDLIEAFSSTGQDLLCRSFWKRSLD